MSEKHTPMYPDIHPETIAADYTAHMHALTDESLYAKSDIAVQLAWRDVEIRRLAEQRDELLETSIHLKEVCNRPSAARTRAEAWRALDVAISKATGQKGENL
jgi:hypothetical protein